ncbi:hypothetical protein [Rhizobium sp. ZW T2_16]|jgi:hypothetical protein|uniref:hypothetical protein n=1 Tax=Rhizobium sp. ZW T2_16 TaxID=3378083 RepID=UPI0038521B9C
MTLSNSNIIAFPSPMNLSIVMRPSARKSICIGELRKLSADERADYIVSIIRPAIGFARRKGTGLDSLPAQLRAWLLELCDIGDPTCMVIRDWLNGNPRFSTSEERA